MQDAGWDLTPYGQAGRSGSGLAVAGDVAGWRDPATSSPGVFVGLATGVRVPAVQAAGSRCPYVQEDDRTIAGLPATVRRHQPCAGSAAALVEAVLAPPDGSYLVFVQVKEPAGGDRADRVLDSLTVRPARDGRHRQPGSMTSRATACCQIGTSRSKSRCIVR